MSPYTPGKAPQQYAAPLAGAQLRIPSASRTLLLIHPASGGPPHRGQPRRRHVRSRPRGATSLALAATDRSPRTQSQRCPRSGSFGVGAGRGSCAGGVAWGALRTAASPTAAEVVDAANTGALEGSSDEGRKRGGLTGGAGLDAASGRVGEERAVNGGATSSGQVQQQRGGKSKPRPKLPAKGTPGAGCVLSKANRHSSAASALMRRMTSAGKKGRWVRVVMWSGEVGASSCRCGYSSRAARSLQQQIRVHTPIYQSLR